MKDDFETYSYKDSGNIQHTIELSKDDFTFVQQDKNIHDTKFKTKPTTFFKDAFKRFRKNKSSVVGGIILGILLIFSFTLPYIIPYDTDENHPDAQYLEPKLFDAGTGFWDGCRYVEAAVCSANKVTEESNENSNYKNNIGDNYYYPSGVSYRAVMNLSESTMSFTDIPDENVTGGYIRLTNSSDLSFNTPLTYVSSSNEVNLDSNLKVNYSLYSNDGDDSFINGNYSFGVNFNGEKYVLVENSNFSKESNVELNISEILASKNISLTQGTTSFFFEVYANSTTNSAIYLKSLSLTSDDYNNESLLNGLSFKDGNEMLAKYQSTANKGLANDLWDASDEDKTFGTVSLYKGEARICSYTLDTYENKLGIKEDFIIGQSTMDRYIEEGLCSYDYSIGKTDPSLAFESLSKSCPIIEVVSQKTSKKGGIEVTNLTCKIYNYLYLEDYGTSMPRFLFGTDKNGKDVLKITFTGLRTSLLLGIFTFVVCFSFGLVLGSIEGYYGGWVDIVIQRLTEILSGVPWIVLMTLIILLMGSTFWTFALALCLTGWIGTSNLTRTQFYRFKNREYILASRTLGAKDGRLIFKHILPNSMGTIITSCVLMIPSVIFSEATISYLGLGLKNMNSLGIILSDNQANLQNYPYTLVVPAIVIALLMICFNLFGNGLRDAFNPSLKGNE